MRQFYVEVLDSDKNVVFSEYHYHSVGNGGIRTFTPPADTTGRFARIRFKVSLMHTSIPSFGMSRTYSQIFEYCGMNHREMNRTTAKIAFMLASLKVSHCIVL